MLCLQSIPKLLLLSNLKVSFYRWCHFLHRFLVHYEIFFKFRLFKSVMSIDVSDKPTGMIIKTMWVFSIKRISIFFLSFRVEFVIEVKGNEFILCLSSSLRCFHYFIYFKYWGALLYLLIMWPTRFSVNPQSIVAWMSSKSLL